MARPALTTGSWHLQLNIDQQKAYCVVELRERDGLLEVLLAPGAPPATQLRAAPTRVAAAARWLTELDATIVDELAVGRTVRREMPIATGAAGPAPRPEASASEYRSLRSPPGRMILPLLLRRPSTTRLFPYQREGASWLGRRTAAILADDMGLGKTAQAVTAISRMIQTGAARYALAVVPRSLLATWEFELDRWAPTLAVMRVVPVGSQRDHVWRTVLGRVHVAITSYEQLRGAGKSLLEFPFDVIVADEAHRIRNLSAQITQGFRKLSGKRVWALTGTPLERHPDDLQTLLGMVSRSSFSPRQPAPPMYVLRAEARPFVLRRRKEDVLKQLPDVVIAMEPLDLLPAQRRAYRSARNRLRGLGVSDGAFLRQLNELRAICDADPVTGASAKVERITEIVADVIRGGEKVVVFSYLLRPLELLESSLAVNQLAVHSRTLTGAASTAERDAIIRSFRTEPSCSVLLASLRVAGEGLTLTEANHVVFFNEWWNPSANAQARDRVVRIGQKRSVTVYRFRCNETIEEDLDRILETKATAFESLIDRLAEGRHSPELEPLLRELQSTVADSGNR